MNRFLLGVLALGIIGLALSFEDPRRKRRAPIRPEISDWEGEGGAVPVDADRTAAQTTAEV
jgi:hypothetical protein